MEEKIVNGVKNLNTDEIEEGDDSNNLTEEDSGEETEVEEEIDLTRSASIEGLPILLKNKMPKLYVYEEKYCDVDGKINDDKTLPNLKDYLCNVPSRLFNLRGPNYLKGDGSIEKNNQLLKVPSDTAAYGLCGIRVFQSHKPIYHSVETIMPVKAFLEEMREFDMKHGKPEGDAPMYLIYCWNFSNFFQTEHTSVVHFTRRNIKIDSSETGESPALDRTMTRFLAADDETRNEKLKFVPRFLEQNMALQGAIDMCGGQRPVLIGKKLDTKYFTDGDCLEINVDVGSKTVSQMFNNIMQKASAEVTYDETIVIEAQKPDELPERALFSCRWNNCSIHNCSIELDAIGHIKEAS